MNFLPDEKELFSLKGENLIGQLTNQRLININTAGDKTQVKVIPIESIDAYEIFSTQNTGLLWLALLAIIWGIPSDHIGLGILAAFIFVIIFMAKKKDRLLCLLPFRKS